MTESPLVDFVVAGAQKSGTRALGRFLSQHPEIGLSLETRPEPHFFDWQLGDEASADSADAYFTYHSMFAPESLAKVTGDITPNYLYDTHALARVRAYNPAMKVIVLLRNPIDRAYSQWAMQRESGRERLAFLPALLNELFTFRKFGQHRNYSYVQRGLYDAQIARLKTLFPEEQCLVLRTESLQRDHASTLARIFGFLGVQSIPVPTAERVHARHYPPMPPLARFLLRSVFRSDIKRLEARLGWDCSEWRS